MARSSSGSSSGLHPYIAEAIKTLGTDGWTTSKIKRDKVTGEITIKIKKVTL